MLSVKMKDCLAVGQLIHYLDPDLVALIDRQSRSRISTIDQNTQTTYGFTCILVNGLDLLGVHHQSEGPDRTGLDN